MALSFTDKLLVCVLVGCLLTGAGWGMIAVERTAPKPVLEHAQLAYPEADERLQKPAVEDELGVTPLRQRVERLRTQEAQQAAAWQQSQEDLHRAQSGPTRQRVEYLAPAEDGTINIVVRPASGLEATRNWLAHCARHAAVASPKLHATREELHAAEALFRPVQLKAQRVYDERTRVRERRLFTLRMAVAAVALWVAWWGWRASISSQSGWRALAVAALIAASLQMTALVFAYACAVAAGQEPLVISILGSITVGTLLVGLNRHIYRQA